MHWMFFGIAMFGVIGLVLNHYRRDHLPLKVGKDFSRPILLGFIWALILVFFSLGLIAGLDVYLKP